MRWVVAALVVACVALWARVSTHRRRLERLDDFTGLWRVAPRSLRDEWVDEMRERWAA